MKKVSTIFAFLIVALSEFVSAGPVYGLKQLTDGLRGVIVVLIQFVSGTILDINSFDEFLFAKILLFTLILLITYTVIKKNSIFGGNDNKPIRWIVASAVSILAIRYLPDNFIQAIMLQYGALAVGLTVFLPLTIYFFFLHQSGVGPFGRKIGWIVFATAFFALWSFRYGEMGNANMIYWVAIGFIAISLVFDKSIHKYFDMSGFRKSEKSINEKVKRHYLRELHQWASDLKEGIVTPEEYEKEAKRIKNLIAELSS